MTKIHYGNLGGMEETHSITIQCPASSAVGKFCHDPKFLVKAFYFKKLSSGGLRDSSFDKVFAMQALGLEFSSPEPT